MAGTQIYDLCGGTLTNTGTISATGGGFTMFYGGTLDNSQGSNSGKLVVSGAGSLMRFGNGNTPTLIIGGTLTATGGGSFDVGGYPVGFDALTAPISISGPLAVTTGMIAYAEGTITNSGTMSLDYGSYLVVGLSGDTRAGADRLVLKGRGKVTLYNGVITSNTTVSGSATFENVDNTITGWGGIVGPNLINGVNGVIASTAVVPDGTQGFAIQGSTLTNAGIIRSAGTGPLTVTSDVATNTGSIVSNNSGAMSISWGNATNSGTISGTGLGVVSLSIGSLINTGTLSETGKSMFLVTGGTLDNSQASNSGKLLVSGAGSVMQFGSGTVPLTIIGGTLSATAGGTFSVGGYPVTLDALTAPISISGPFAVTTGMIVHAAGTITNSGTMSFDDGSVLAVGLDGDARAGADRLVLKGRGTVTLNNGVISSNSTVSGTATFENVDNTINGWGGIVGPNLINGVNGIIDSTAVVSDRTRGFAIQGSTLTNAGIIRSSGSGPLGVTADVVTNTGSVVSIGTGALSISWGSATNSGTISGAGLGGVSLSIGTLINTGTLSETGKSWFGVTGGTLDNSQASNSGKLLVSGTGSVMQFGSGTVPLTIIGGTLSATVGGSFVVGGYPVTLNALTAPMSISGPFAVTIGMIVHAAGTLTNSGPMSFDDGSVLAVGLDGDARAGADRLVLKGRGTVTLNNGVISSNSTVSGTATFENVDNTINGWGGIVGPNLINGVDAIIDSTAVVSDRTRGFAIQGSTLTNAGIIRSSGTGSMSVTGDVATNTGSVVAVGTGTLGISWGSATNSGTIQTVGAGGLALTGTTLLNTGTLQASGVGAFSLSSTSVTNNGLILASGGTFISSTYVDGTGTIQLQNGGLVDLVVGSSDAVRFADYGAYGRLQLDVNSSYTGVISGFAGASSIDLRGLGFVATASSVRYSAGVLTVSEGGASVSLKFAGTYTAGSFRVSDDGYGGTLIASINGLYGTAGNDTLRSTATLTTLIGGLGNDTYYVSQPGVLVVELANQGTDTVIASVSYALSANVENLTLNAAGISGTGNSANNTLSDFTGAGAGNQMAGGLGDDTYIVTKSTDVIVENVNEGNDTVRASASFALAANVENLALTAAGISGTGNAGNNTLSDFTGAGAGNRMSGGLGDDTYIVTKSTDVIVENVNEGTDTVRASASFTLAANVENLVLTAAGISGTGNAGNNTLSDFTGAGAGNQLAGGLGDDTYIVTKTTDVIVENANEGTDTVKSSVNFTLAANVENLTLTAAGISGTGNAGNNTLSDFTGAGAGNRMSGGLGDDTYIVTKTTDVIVENANEGTDTILSSVNFTLAANVENLTLTAAGISGTGNTGNNILSDFTGGGAGNRLAGGRGDDTYIVTNSADVIVENANEGNDTVLSSVNFTLAANVETLTLTGAGNLNGFGNTGANVIRANSGNDVLDGKGGNDTLYGGAGQNTFLFNRGYGSNTIVNTGFGADADVLKFGSTVTDYQLWFQQVGNDLKVSVIGTNDSVTVQGWYSAADRSNQISTLKDGGGLALDRSAVDNLVSAMAGLPPPPFGTTTLPAGLTAVQAAIAANWH